MKNRFSSYWFTPDSFHYYASQFSHYRWRLLLWSGMSFLLYTVLESQIQQVTPDELVWLALFILFAALQALVLSSFIFFFRKLPSKQVSTGFWYKFYRGVEWCETILFTFLLPLPCLIFCYALYRSWW